MEKTTLEQKHKHHSMEKTTQEQKHNINNMERYENRNTKSKITKKTIKQKHLKPWPETQKHEITDAVKATRDKKQKGNP